MDNKHLRVTSKIGSGCLHDIHVQKKKKNKTKEMPMEKLWSII